MARQDNRLRRPDGITQAQISKASLIFIAASEIALDQIYPLEQAKTHFYKREVKFAMNSAKKVLEAHLEKFLKWDGDPEAEKGYQRIARMVEDFCSLLTETKGENLLELGALLESFRKGEYVSVDEDTFKTINNDSNG